LEEPDRVWKEEEKEQEDGKSEGIWREVQSAICLGFRGGRVDFLSVPFLYLQCEVVDNPSCTIVRSNSLVTQIQKPVVAQGNPQTSVKSDIGSLSSNHDCDASGIYMSVSIPDGCSTG